MIRTWADSAREVIDDVRRKNPTADAHTLKQLLHAAYPFGRREMFPYKVWCREVREVLGANAKKRANEQDESAILFAKPEARP